MGFPAADRLGDDAAEDALGAVVEIDGDGVFGDWPTGNCAESVKHIPCPIRVVRAIHPKDTICVVVTTNSAYYTRQACSCAQIVVRYTTRGPEFLLG